MITEIQSSTRHISDNLNRDGFVFLRRWRPEQTTLVLSRSMGKLVDIPTLLPNSDIPTVQVLRPSHQAASSSTRYSGIYGLAEFPLHTDFSYWLRPPRYLLLRCLKGSAAVTTSLLDWSELSAVTSLTALRRAIVRPRRRATSGAHCLLPLVFHVGGACGFRWDPVFLVPMNKPACQFGEIMSSRPWKRATLMSLVLADPGDTLIIDNWRLLHGRSEVPSGQVGRRLERVYLSEIRA